MLRTAGVATGTSPAAIPFPVAGEHAVFAALRAKLPCRSFAIEAGVSPLLAAPADVIPVVRACRGSSGADCLFGDPSFLALGLFQRFEFGSLVGQVG